MNPYHVRLYTSGEVLPDMTCRNFFHSPALFHIIERTPGQKPYMAVATDDAGQVVGHMLAIVRRRGSLIPPYLYTQGRIYGEGDYEDDQNSEEIFGQLLYAMTRKLRRKLCFYTEFSDLSRKMFGYRFFRKNSFVPIGWQEVYNSLHSKSPAERITDKMHERIEHVYDLGVITREAENEQEVRLFHRLLRRFFRFKPHRLPPPEELLVELFKSTEARVFITMYKKKIIGGCVCAYSEGNAYLWYLASRRKSYPHLHPNMMTIWHAMNWAWEHNYAHFCFLDVGLPYPRNPYREFILSFGGKPVATFRWFRFSIGWVNRLVSWFYQE
ncbi:MAG: GNAT family N-acetyltransferase [Prevotella sp.]|nr:GNAT family N-acetyltransferase [Prevotella sp.]